MSASTPDSSAAETASGVAANPGRFRIARPGGSYAGLAVTPKDDTAVEGPETVVVTIAASAA